MKRCCSIWAAKFWLNLTTVLSRHKHTKSTRFRLAACSTVDDKRDASEIAESAENEQHEGTQPPTKFRLGGQRADDDTWDLHGPRDASVDVEVSWYGADVERKSQVGETNGEPIVQETRTHIK